MYFATPVVDGSRIYFSSRYISMGSPELVRDWFIDYGGKSLLTVTPEALLFVQMLWELQRLLRTGSTDSVCLTTETQISTDSWIFIRRFLQRNGANSSGLELAHSTNTNPNFRTSNEAQWNIAPDCLAFVHKEYRRAYAKTVLRQVGFVDHRIQFGTINIGKSERSTLSSSEPDESGEIVLTTDFWADVDSMEKSIAQDYFFGIIGFIPVILSCGFSDVLGFESLLDTTRAYSSADGLVYSATLSRDYCAFQNFLNHACGVPTRFTNGAPFTTDLVGHLVSDKLSNEEMQRYRRSIMNGRFRDDSALMFVLNDLALGHVYSDFDYLEFLSRSAAFSAMTSILASSAQVPLKPNRANEIISFGMILIYVRALSVIVNDSLLGDSELDDRCRSIKRVTDLQHTDADFQGVSFKGRELSNSVDLRNSLLHEKVLGSNIDPGRISLLGNRLCVEITFSVASSWPSGFTRVQGVSEN